MVGPKPMEAEMKALVVMAGLVLGQVDGGAAEDARMASSCASVSPGDWRQHERCGDWFASRGRFAEAQHLYGLAQIGAQASDSDAATRIIRKWSAASDEKYKQDMAEIRQRGEAAQAQIQALKDRREAEEKAKADRLAAISTKRASFLEAAKAKAANPKLEGFRDLKWDMSPDEVDALLPSYTAPINGDPVDIRTACPAPYTGIAILMPSFDFKVGGMYAEVGVGFESDKLFQVAIWNTFDHDAADKALSWFDLLEGGLAEKYGKAKMKDSGKTPKKDGRADAVRLGFAELGREWKSKTLNITLVATGEAGKIRVMLAYTSPDGNARYEATQKKAKEAAQKEAAKGL